MLTWIAIVVVAVAGLVLAALNYSIVFPRQPFRRPLPEPTEDELALAVRLETHVRAVASRPHNLDYYPALEASALYIEDTLRGMGHAPERQEYRVRGQRVRNVEVVIAPREGSANHTPTYVIGAHYDSPDDSPGANDNGSGVAAALELARALRGLEPQRHRLRIVFWVNEEAPYGKTPDMGSYRHAERLSQRGEKVLGALALETLGYFSDMDGSQNFPPPFGLVYPDRGNFVAFVALPGGRGLVRRLVRSFRCHTAFPSIGGVAPGFIRGIDYSDHWAYHQFGYPALMITDTAPFRNPRYHQPHDLPETVDYLSLARITTGLERVLREIVT